MEERRVSVDGRGHALPDPFIVIATQNPEQHTGTHPLPESQLDRFLMRLHLGHPGREAERLLLAGPDRRGLLAALAPELPAGGLAALQAEVAAVRVSDPLRSYLLDLLGASRAGDVAGLSARAGLDLQQAARAWAFLEGRGHVLPEDVQAVFGAVAAHRLGAGDAGEDRARRLLSAVPVP